MNEPSARFWEIFFDLYENLPRQGPGNRRCAQRALSFCPGLSEKPVVLDLGCGVGAQTLHLTELIRGSIVAVDSHEPSIARLQRTLEERGLTDRVRTICGDMSQLEFVETFDLIWSEGALYNLGIEAAMTLCHGLLKPSGYLVFTDAVWLKDNPPAEVKASFEFDYPTMGSVADVIAVIEKSGFSLEGHFTLPDEAWWDDFYTPMERRIEELRESHQGDVEALGILDQLAEEPNTHRAFGSFYGYEFFIARRQDESKTPE